MTPTALKLFAKFLLDEYSWRPEEGNILIGEFLCEEEPTYHIGGWVSPENREMLCNLDAEKMRAGLRLLYEYAPYHVCERGVNRPAVHPALSRLANMLAAESAVMRTIVAEALDLCSYDEFCEARDSKQFLHYVHERKVEAWQLLVSRLQQYFEQSGCVTDLTESLCIILDSLRG